MTKNETEIKKAFNIILMWICNITNENVIVNKK